MKLLSPITAFSLLKFYSTSVTCDWINWNYKLPTEMTFCHALEIVKKELMFMKISWCMRYNCICLKINSSGYSHCSLTFFSHLNSCVVHWAKHWVWEMNPEGFRDPRSLCGTPLLGRHTFGKHKQKQFSGMTEMVPVDGMNSCKALTYLYFI